MWTGSQALELGLVDELGGLADAIAYAAQSAELAKGFRVSEFPAKKELAEVIAEVLEQFQPSATKAGWLNKVSQEASKVVSELEQFNDPRGVYARMPFDLLIK